MIERSANVICDHCNAHVSVTAKAPSEPEGVTRQVARGLVISLARSLRWTVDVLTGAARCPRCPEQAP